MIRGNTESLIRDMRQEYENAIGRYTPIDEMLGAYDKYLSDEQFKKNTWKKVKELCQQGIIDSGEVSRQLNIPWYVANDLIDQYLIMTDYMDDDWENNMLYTAHNYNFSKKDYDVFKKMKGKVPSEELLEKVKRVMIFLSKDGEISKEKGLKAIRVLFNTLTTIAIRLNKNNADFDCSSLIKGELATVYSEYKKHGRVLGDNSYKTQMERVFTRVQQECGEDAFEEVMEDVLTASQIFVKDNSSVEDFISNHQLKVSIEEDFLDDEENDETEDNNETNESTNEDVNDSDDNADDEEEPEPDKKEPEPDKKEPVAHLITRKYTYEEVKDIPALPDWFGMDQEQRKEWVEKALSAMEIVLSHAYGCQQRIIWSSDFDFNGYFTAISGGGAKSSSLSFIDGFAGYLTKEKKCTISDLKEDIEKDEKAKTTEIDDDNYKKFTAMDKKEQVKILLSNCRIVGKIKPGVLYESFFSALRRLPKLATTKYFRDLNKLETPFYTAFKDYYYSKAKIPDEQDLYFERVWCKAIWSLGGEGDMPKTACLAFWNSAKFQLSLDDDKVKKLCETIADKYNKGSIEIQEKSSNFALKRILGSYYIPNGGIK